MPNEVTWIPWDNIMSIFLLFFCDSRLNDEKRRSARFFRQILWVTDDSFSSSPLTSDWTARQLASAVLYAGGRQSSVTSFGSVTFTTSSLTTTREHVDDQRAIRLASFIVVVNVDDVWFWGTWWCLLLTQYHHIVTIIIIINKNKWMAPWWQFVVQSFWLLHSGTLQLIKKFSFHYIGLIYRCFSVINI